MNSITENKPGIKSILEELKDIKTKLDINTSTNIIENTDREIHKKNIIRRINKYESLHHQFIELVGSYLKDPVKNLSYICESAVRFIEINKKTLFKIFDISRDKIKESYNDFKSKKKLEFCIDFIKSVVTIDNINFVIDLINHFVTLLFNQKNKKLINFKVNTLSILR